jgi:predicted TPR repeat methyltransferase
MHEHAAQLQQDDCGPGRAVLPLDAAFARGRLTWWPQLGIGHYPVESANAPYDQDYFDNFARNAQTDLGQALMRARCEFVERHYRGTLVDVGIGSGAFVEAWRQRGRSASGYDINQAGLKWLREQKLLVDPYHTPFDAMTLWDVLEHVDEFQRLLVKVRKWLFVSLPIFCDAEHVLRSKHFKPQEHFWYFSRDGLVYAMRQCGFLLVSESTVESELGREDIGTFAFKREDVGGHG